MGSAIDRLQKQLYGAASSAAPSGKDGGSAIDRVQNMVYRNAPYTVRPERSYAVKAAVKERGAQKKQEDPGFFERVGSTVKGVLQRQASGYAGAAENALELTRHMDTLASTGYQRAQQERKNAAHYRDMLKRGTLDDGTVIDDAMRERLTRMAELSEKRADIGVKGTEEVHKPITGLIDKTDAYGDRMSADAEESFDRAKQGAGTVGRVLVDAAGALGDVAADAGANWLLPGLGAAGRFVRTYGHGAEAAEDKGLGVGRQALYGAGSAALGEGINRLFSGNPILEKATGKGALDDLLFPNLGKTLPGRMVKSGLGEAIEEGVESIADPFLQQAALGKEQADPLDWKDVGYDALIGGLVGGLTGISKPKSAQKAPAQTAGTPQDGGGGVDVPAVQDGAQGAPEPVRVGQVTTIKNPYQGVKPVQTQKSTAAIPVDSGSVERAQNRINGARGLESSLPGKGFKATLKEAYKSVFKPAKGVPVNGVTFDGKPYAVDINGTVPGKIISDPNLTAEKLALLDILPQIVQNGEYVGSGDYVQHSSKKKLTIRFDYFETPVVINGKPYVAAFDVEVFPNTNNYRTHRLEKIELSPAENADVGPAPTASATETAPVEGTRPLNVDSTIPQNAEPVNSMDPLLRLILGGKRVDQSKASNEQFAGSQPESMQEEDPPMWDGEEVPIDSVEGRRTYPHINKIFDQETEYRSTEPTAKPEGDGLGAANAGFLGDSERGFSKNVSTDEKMAPELRESFQDDPEMYFRLGNKETLEEAQAIYNKGLEHARSTLEKALGAAQSGMKLSPEMVPLSRMVANELTRQGDWYSARKILSDVSVELTEAGQLGQAAVILRDTGYAGKVMTIEKLVERAKQALSADGLDIQVEDGLFKAYADAKTDAEQDAAIEAIQQRIAEQVPATLLEKWTALRYVNMLGNFKTQVRNVTGNVSMALVSRAKNTIAAALEALADKASGGRSGRTKSVVVGRSLLNAAKADFANVRKSALGEGKFSVDDPSSNDFVQGIKDRQRVFKFAPAEGYRKATNWAMNNRYFGDEAFVRAAYARALGGYLKANGITAEQFGSEAWRGKHADIVDEARAYAVKEAQETTFRDHNTLSDWVSRIGRRPNTPKSVQALSAGMMPFRRTPANVLARAEEYSPLGLLNTAYMGAKKALSTTSATKSRGLIGEAARSGGDIRGTDIINSLSKALTGTGLFVFGMYLKSLGMIRSGADDDEKQAAFDDLTGHQDYALELPNGLSVTIDWLSPTAMPLFMGAQLEQLREDGGIDLKDIESALTSLADPMIEMSMMQGINDAVDDLKFSDNNLIQLAISSSLSYLTQGLTNTLVGQVRRAYSGENMMTYVDKDSPVPDWLQRELGSASKKSLFPAFQQIPYIDAWGREEETGDPMERAVNNLFNPAYISQVDVDKVERELQRVKDATGDGGVLPQRAERSIEFGGETHDLTAEQYQKYAKAKGRNSYSMVSGATNSAAYRTMGSGEKAEFIKKMYGYADYKAKQAVFPSYRNDAYAKYEEAEAEGITPQEFYIYKERTGGLMADKDSNGESIPGTKKAKVIDAISNLPLSPTEKDWLYLLNYDGKNARSDLRGMPWNR